MKFLSQLTLMQILKILAGSFFVTTWLAMCVYNLNQLSKENQEFTFGPLDVVRRVSAPNGGRTAILVRSYASFLDLNFVLYVSDDRYIDISDSTSDASFVTDAEIAETGDMAFWIERALWISPDYEPTTSRNWHEDIIWSQDSSIIAVTIDDQYVFAYDFETKQRYEQEDEIQDLLSLHS